jgi:hypothetical protein
MDTATQTGRLALPLPNLDIGGGRNLETLTMISVVVGVVGLAVGVVQIVLTLMQIHKGKKNRH